MDVHAHLRHLRMAPRKVRLVVDLIRGVSVTEAERRLSFLKKDAARPVLKLLQSAVANAQHNFKLDPATLVVKTITADGGKTLKRMRPRAMGRSAPIRKRTTHINITLAPASEVPVRKGVKKTKPVAAPAPAPEAKKPAARAPRAKKAAATAANA